MKTFSIIFENEEILLVNKEAGVSVQGGAGIAHPLDAELSLQLGYKIFLVHRLDKETSGILVVAKNALAAAKWTNLISGGKVKKEYTAVCFGIPFVNGKKCYSGVLEGTVEAHGRTQAAKTFFKVESVWDVKIPETDEKMELSFLKLTLGTGRMHQIRIQLAKAFCPIAGDDKHGDFKKNKLARKIGIKKLHLAAVRLSLPIDGKMQTFEIPLPEYIKNTLSSQ
ncbi:RluA family pseudouridine synthase [uncultured Treponema sp.]|uniref:RluA family pseudouridine synthase n=1 Tax=uncultured Treponema sp. TaxID=162155 RepID=UPI0025EDC23E|nr:RluA family pseudouridine synthase [uncultured Treponema sp.]